MISRLGRTQLERFMGEAMSTMAVKRLVKAADNLILAVDGHEPTLGRIRQFVGQLGCELVEAATAEEIAQIVSLRTPRVAIVAIDTHLSDGLAVLETLSAHIEHLKVLLIGAVDRRVMAGACRIAQAHGLQVIGSIDRQFDSAELTSLLGRHVHAQRALGLDDLERALEEQQFLLHYQPKAIFEAEGLTIQGVEALVRWEHPQHGLLYPADFLPLMDGHDLLVRLTDFVMTSALRQAGLWRQGGLELQLALNLSP
jgi:CheY-like chemotaxis protein